VISHQSKNPQASYQWRYHITGHQLDQQSMQREQAEAVLQASELLFRTIWEYASDAMALSTSTGTVIAANPAYFHLYGYPPEEVLGKNFSIIFPEQYRTSAQEMYTYLFQSPTISPSIEGPIRRVDGTERFVETSYTFIPDLSHRLAMLSIIRDITERKMVEEALWVCEEKLRVALDVGQMVSWEWDIESDTIRLSAHPKVASGLAQDTFGPRDETFMKLVHPQDRLLLEQEMRRALEEGTDYELEFRAVLPNGTERWKTYGQVIADETGKPVRLVCISRGIS
jgi:PAS domain S-box-containing protein